MALQDVSEAELAGGELSTAHGTAVTTFTTPCCWCCCCISLLLLLLLLLIDGS
jgi:hypothetical protein